MAFFDLKNKLFFMIGENLCAFGFSKTRNNAFIKSIDFGRVCFHLSFIDHKNDFDIISDIAIRFDKLEDIINDNNKMISEKEKKNTYSIGVELGNLKNKKQLRWSVHSEKDVYDVVDSIIREFINTALPYIEKYSSMESAYSLLSMDSQDSWIHSPIHGARAKKAVGLAYLLEKPEISTLIDSKKHFLEEKKDPGLLDFLNFVKNLGIS